MATFCESQAIWLPVLLEISASSQHLAARKRWHTPLPQNSPCLWLGSHRSSEALFPASIPQRPCSSELNYKTVKSKSDATAEGVPLLTLGSERLTYFWKHTQPWQRLASRPRLLTRGKSSMQIPQVPGWQVHRYSRSGSTLGQTSSGLVPISFVVLRPTTWL